MLCCKLFTITLYFAPPHPSPHGSSCLSPSAIIHTYTRKTSSHVCAAVDPESPRPCTPPHPPGFVDWGGGGVHVAPPASPGAPPCHLSLAPGARESARSARMLLRPDPCLPGDRKGRGTVTIQTRKSPWRHRALPGSLPWPQLTCAFLHCGRRSTRVHPTLPSPQRLSSCRSRWPPSLVDRPCTTRN